VLSAVAATDEAETEAGAGFAFLDFFPAAVLPFDLLVLLLPSSASLPLLLQLLMESLRSRPRV
jgi:hypothetical protein